MSSPLRTIDDATMSLQRYVGISAVNHENKGISQTRVGKRFRTSRSSVEHVAAAAAALPVQALHGGAVDSIVDGLKYRITMSKSLMDRLTPQLRGPGAKLQHM